MENTKNSVLKKNKVVKVVSAVLLAGVVFLGSSAVADLNNYQTSTQNDAYEIAGELSVNTSYVMKKLGRIGRMQHNSGKPIYISFSDDVSVQTKQESIKALDYIFDIVSNINENYKYEIVDSVDGLQYLNKTTIEFSTRNFEGDGSNTEGLFEHLPNETSFVGSKGVLFKNVNIYLDNDAQNAYYTALHELAHAFGIGDVYSQEVHNSLTNVWFSDLEYPQLTPNDYKILWSLYAPNFKNEQEKQDYINKANTKIDEYAQSYYKNLLQSKREYQMKDMKESGKYSDERIKQIITTQPINNIDVKFDSVSNVNVNSIRVKVKDGRYVIATYDDKMNMVDNCKGIAHIVDGEIFLADVTLNKFTGKKQTYTDLHISLNAHSQEYAVTTTSNMQVSLHGYNSALEQSANLSK